MYHANGVWMATVRKRDFKLAPLQYEQFILKNHKGYLSSYQYLLQPLKLNSLTLTLASNKSKSNSDIFSSTPSNTT